MHCHLIGYYQKQPLEVSEWFLNQARKVALIPLDRAPLGNREIQRETRKKFEGEKGSSISFHDDCSRFLQGFLLATPE